jgi:hypothetical protein
VTGWRLRESRIRTLPPKLGITAQKAARWWKRFLASGTQGLEKDGPHAQRLRHQGEASNSKNNTGEAGPSNPLVHAMAAARPRCGASGTTTLPKPHLVEAFKVSADPHFAERLEAVIGLY